MGKLRLGKSESSHSDLDTTFPEKGNGFCTIPIEERVDESPRGHRNELVLVEELRGEPQEGLVRAIVIEKLHNASLIIRRCLEGSIPLALVNLKVHEALQERHGESMTTRPGRSNHWAELSKSMMIFIYCLAQREREGS